MRYKPLDSSAEASFIRDGYLLCRGFFRQEEIDKLTSISLFFHSNSLHRSDSDLSDHSRLSLISVYNLITNRPFKGNNTFALTPISKVHDDAILNTEVKGISQTVHFNHN